MGKKHDLSINSLSYHSTEDEEDKSCKNSLFFGLFDDSESTRLRSGSMKRQYSDMGDIYHRVYEERHDDVNYGDGDDEGSKVDMRVLMLLEYMRELYVGQLQVLKKMFPGGAKDEFLGFFTKIGDAMSQFKKDSRPLTKSKTMQRSLSVNLGSTELRDKRFKVTTVEAGGAPAGGAGGAAGGAGTSGAAGGGKGGSAAGQGQPKK
ncbi:hypothetical protein BRARA_E00657 [Brassica rapa]|uniref:Uncharacterized protein n=2 Tax=Brassica TaxID=3705 RepID=A0A397Z7P8_BRACM|nr:uncharacterized protein LOC106450970 [Brassica napus]RID61515.1 hypothetical protein BRARA_E00657 [Brassica rapa]KAH0925110.1 hypothetical protein HID58_017366 [Brassica napus]CAF2094777.1 unnamed protein product [Brassica napus]CAG7874220.1 unnamed protein product [Brassica rapa]VDC69987.1 unnamed protein product [Brassica rapa]